MPEFRKLERIGGGCFSREGRLLAFCSDRTGILNVYTAEIGNYGLTQLTDSDTAVLPLQYFPHDDRLLLRILWSTDSTDQLWVFSENEELRPITPAGVHVEFLSWSRNGKSFYVLSNERDPSLFDVVEMRTDDDSARRIYEETDWRRRVWCIDGDGSAVAFHRVDGACREIGVLDLASREQEIILRDRECDLLPEYFDPSGRYVHYLSDLGREFRYACRYDRVTKASEVVFEDDWDVTCTSLSPRGTYLIVLLNEDAAAVTRILRRADGRALPQPALPGRVIAAELSHDERRAAIHYSSDTCPRALAVWQLDTDEVHTIAAPQPVAAAEEMAESEVVRFRSFDGMEIPSLLYVPPKQPRDVPAVLWLHGGPGGQARRDYDPQLQFLVASGYAVLAVNYRGSGGYGKSFEKADRGKLGREPLWDCIAAKGFLARLPGIDGRRVAVMGESFGGFMALAALAFHPGEFAAGIDLFGVADWLHVLRSMPSHWTRIRESHFARLGDPSRDEEALRAVSPFFSAERIRAPLFVAQGARDVRVPRAQTDALVEKVRANGVAVEYVVYEDEAHGLIGAANRADLYQRTVAFLDRHLRD